MKKVTGMLIMALLSAGLLTFLGCKKSAGLPEFPAVTTSGISVITPVTAETGGLIISSGDSYVTLRGVCWDTSSGPTIYGSRTNDGSGPGAFTSRLTGLNPETTYYVRAYARNAEGTAYGEEISFTTDNFDYETVTDIEGNSYKTIRIGNQNWMAENLKVTKYNDGSSIQNVTNYQEWSALETGAFCWYENNVNKFKKYYGALYNNHAVITNRLCPDGWHVPSDDDFSELALNLGGTEIAGGKLKATGNSLWIHQNLGATNESGFNALPAGMRYVAPDPEIAEWIGFDWLGEGYSAYWWATPADFNDSLVYWVLQGAMESFYPVHNEYQTETEESGLSVRCIQD